MLKKLFWKKILFDKIFWQQILIFHGKGDFFELLHMFNFSKILELDRCDGWYNIVNELNATEL